MATGQQHPISEFLEHAGRRKDWLAKQVGIHPSLLSHYLAGRRHPPESFYQRAAALLGVPERLLRK